MTKAMDIETAKRVLAENYKGVILVDDNIGKCQVIYKNNVMQDLSNVRLYMGPSAGVNLSVQQVYTPTPAMMLAGLPATKKISQLMGEQRFIHKDEPKANDPNKWQCECGEENDYRDSKQRVKKKGTEHQCGTCLQWTKVESERMAG
jgi:hypothetical protein